MPTCFLRMSLIKRNKSCKTKVKETYEVKTLRTFYLWSIKVPPASLTKWWLSDYYQRNLHCISLKCLIYKFIKTDLKKTLILAALLFINSIYKDMNMQTYANFIHAFQPIEKSCSITMAFSFSDKIYNNMNTSYICTLQCGYKTG